MLHAGIFFNQILQYILKKIFGTVKFDTQKSRDVLPDEAREWKHYLRSVRELHSVCVAHNLVDYKSALKEVRSRFDTLYYKFI